MSDKKHKNELRKYLRADKLEEMKLDDKQALGYTFKCAGAGFYGLRKGTDFRSSITQLIMEGGDADTNGAVFGALLGCKIGFSALPEDLMRFPHRQWLDEKVDMFLKTIGLKD